MQYMIPDKIYKIIKWGCVLILPAVATLISKIGPAWGMDAGLTQSIITTITAISAFGGAIMGVSAATAKNK